MAQTLDRIKKCALGTFYLLKSDFKCALKIDFEVLILNWPLLYFSFLDSSKWNNSNSVWTSNTLESDSTKVFSLNFRVAKSANSLLKNL